MILKIRICLFIFSSFCMALVSRRSKQHPILFVLVSEGIVLFCVCSPFQVRFFLYLLLLVFSSRFPFSCSFSSSSSSSPPSSAFPSSSFRCSYKVPSHEITIIRLSTLPFPLWHQPSACPSSPHPKTSSEGFPLPSYLVVPSAASLLCTYPKHLSFDSMTRGNSSR